MSSPQPDRDEPLARLVHARELRHDIDHGLHAIVAALERAQRHRVLKDAGDDRMTLGVVGVQEALRGGPVDHLRELPAQVHRILHTEAEALSAGGVVHVRRVAGQEDSSHPVGRGLPRHVGEPGDPRRIVDPEVGAVHGDQRLAQIAQGGLAARPDLLLGHDDPERPPVLHPAAGRGCRWRRDARPAAAPRSARPRRSGCSSSDPTRGTRCRPPCGSGCVRRRSRRDTAPAATGRLTARRRRRSRPARSPSPRFRSRSAPPARRSRRP